MRSIETRKLYYDEETLFKVRKVLESKLGSHQLATDIINSLQNEGILFRERVKEEVDGN